MATAIEIIGWAGSIAVLVGYALLSTGRLAAASLRYQAINLAGASGMALNGWWHGALPSMFNNVVWMTIGLVALLRLTGRRAPR